MKLSKGWNDKKKEGKRRRKQFNHYYMGLNEKNIKKVYDR